MAPAENERNEADRLDGWKEISTYLRCDIRTCLRWEKDLGLPVIRINKDSKRSKVIAYKSAIDQWLSGGKKIEARIDTSRKRNGRLVKIGLVSAAILILASAAYWLFLASPSSGPAYFGLKGQTLVFYDTKDRELWRKDIASVLNQESFYNDPPLLDSQGNSLRKLDRQKIALADVDRDGKKEVACFLNHDDPSRRSIALFDHSGKEIWEKTPEFGESYPLAAPTYDFRLVQVDIEDINGDGAMEILSLWKHDRDFPGVFEVRSLKGDLLFQYDHTGVLQFFIVSGDPKGQSSKEILLGGTNNLLGGDAVLAILDCANLKSGLGPPYSIPDDLQSKESELKTFVPVAAQRAAQKRYYRFRHNELSAAYPIKYLNVTEIHASPESLLIRVKYGVDVDLNFRFGPNGRLLLAFFGADSERIYRNLFNQKKMSLTKEAFEKKAENDVFAWDGEGWIPAAKASR